MRTGDECALPAGRVRAGARAFYCPCVLTDYDLALERTVRDCKSQDEFGRTRWNKLVLIALQVRCAKSNR